MLTKCKKITLLMKSIIVYHKHPALFNKLVIKDTINDVTSDNWTVLMIACRHSKLLLTENLIPILIEHGADINKQTDDGFTAIMLSFDCELSTLDTLKILLKYGADVNKQAIGGFTLLMLVCEKIIDTELSENNVKLLLKYGADVNKKTIAEYTALMLTSNVNIMIMLLDHGAMYTGTPIIRNQMRIYCIIQ